MKLKRLVCILVVCLAGAAPAEGPSDATKLNDYFPAIEPYETGYLKVSELHEIRYELCGNPKGKPVMVLHGGPGGGSYPALRRYHDPDKYLIVLHDQRGAGRSQPSCELKDNNTSALVEDIERLRKHLELGKVQVFGGSWGSTLAVAYAETYPDNVSALVLRGVFLGTRAEIDHFYHDGIKKFFPEVHQRLQAIIFKPEQRDYAKQLLDLLRGTDETAKREAALGWARYELRTAFLDITDDRVESYFKRWDPYDFALIENYYMANGCFLSEDQLLRNAGKIASIPTIIVQGRYDMICPPITAWKLHKALPKSKLVIVESAGHSASEPGIRSALIDATRSLE